MTGIPLHIFEISPLKSELFQKIKRYFYESSVGIPKDFRRIISVM